MRKEHPVKWQKLKEINSKKGYWQWMEEHGVTGGEDGLSEEDIIYQEYKRNIPAEANNRYTQLLRTTGVEELYKAIEKLTTKQGEVIMAILNEIPETEIARHMNISQQRVNRIKQASITALAKHLQHLKENGVADSLGRDK